MTSHKLACSLCDILSETLYCYLYGKRRWSPLQSHVPAGVMDPSSCHIEDNIKEVCQDNNYQLLPHITVTLFGFLDSGMHADSFVIDAHCNDASDCNETSSYSISFPRVKACAKQTNARTYNIMIKDTAVSILSDDLNKIYDMNIALHDQHLKDHVTLCVETQVENIIRDCENICVTLSIPMDEQDYSVDAFKSLQETFMLVSKETLKDVIYNKRPVVRLDQCEARYAMGLEHNQTVSFIYHPPLIPRYFQILGLAG